MSAAAVDASRLHVSLYLTNGYFAVDSHTTFEPTADFTKSFSGSSTTAKTSLVESLNQAFRSHGRVILLDPDESDAIASSKPPGLVKYDPIIKFTGSWDEACAAFTRWVKTNKQNIDEIQAQNYLPNLLQNFVEDEGGLQTALAETPCLWREIDTTDYDVLAKLYAGSFDLVVADPISDADIKGDIFAFGDNRGAFDYAGITPRKFGHLLESLKGEMLNEARIQRQVGDFLADIGLESYYSVQSPGLQWTPESSANSKSPPTPFHYIQLFRRPEERQIILNGSPRISAIQIAVHHADTMVLRELLYLILPQDDFQKVFKNPQTFLTNTVGTIEGSNSVEFVILHFTSSNGSQLPHAAPYINHRVLQGQLSRIQTLGYQAALYEDAKPPTVGFPANDKKWARLVVFPITGFGAASHVSEANNANNNSTMTNKVVVAKPYRNHLQVGGGIESHQPPTVLLEYSRDELFTNDSVAIKLGWRDEPIFGGNYQRDFFGFGTLGRRLSISVAGDSDFKPDRLVDGLRADERRSGGSFGAQLELFRDKQDNWLRLEASISHQAVEVKNTSIQNVGSDDISRATIGLSYSWLREAMAGSPGLEINPSISVGRASRDDAVFLQTSIKSAFHRNLPGFFEMDSRGSFDWASSGTPSTELPKFGGEDSVRGFRLEAASGRLVWALQNEFWVPLRFTDNFGETAGRLLRRNLKLAAFVDIGGVDHAQGGISPFEAGAGLGLRFTIKDQATLRLDWAHPLTSFTHDQGGHAVYFSILLKPAHF